MPKRDYGTSIYLETDWVSLVGIANVFFATHCVNFFNKGVQRYKARIYGMNTLSNAFIKMHLNNEKLLYYCLWRSRESVKLSSRVFWLTSKLGNACMEANWTKKSESANSLLF